MSSSPQHLQEALPPLPPATTQRLRSRGEASHPQPPKRIPIHAPGSPPAGVQRSTIHVVRACGQKLILSHGPEEEILLQCSERQKHIWTIYLSACWSKHCQLKSIVLSAWYAAAAAAAAVVTAASAAVTAAPAIAACLHWKFEEAGVVFWYEPWCLWSNRCLQCSCSQNSSWVVLRFAQSYLCCTENSPSTELFCCVVSLLYCCSVVLLHCCTELFCCTEKLPSFLSSKLPTFVRSSSARWEQPDRSNIHLNTARLVIRFVWFVWFSICPTFVRSSARWEQPDRSNIRL